MPEGSFVFGGRRYRWELLMGGMTRGGVPVGDAVSFRCGRGARGVLVRPFGEAGWTEVKGAPLPEPTPLGRRAIEAVNP